MTDITPPRMPASGPMCKCLTAVIVALASVSVRPTRAAGQAWVAPFVTLTSESEERIRLRQLLGTESTAGFMLRSASRLSAPYDTAAPPYLQGILPDVRVIHNSGIPYSLNNAPLWAGRGWNESLTTGFVARRGIVTVVAAPTFIAEENLPFQVIPYPQTGTQPRSVWANPFHPLPESIDLPLRFGDRRMQRLTAGQSSVTVSFADASVGIATENLWWGPAIRNAITLSNNAPGFPHLFAQLRPRRTSYGTFDAQWIAGVLRESDFFDADSSNDTRSLSGLAFTWSPPSDTGRGLTIGIARLFMAARAKGRLPLSTPFDVFHTAGHANTDTASQAHTDQVTSLFARWVFPRAGFEGYVEWARFEEPLSFRDFLEFPGHSEGYTLGFQWAHPRNANRTFRLQGEASYLEPDPSLRVRPVASTYTSRGVPQGFTNEGRTLGAAIGPGASSQWLAADEFARRWRFGAYLGRIRWDNGTLFEPIVPQFKRQDVTLLGGLRASTTWQDMNVAIDFTHAARFYYLFQAYTLGPVQVGGIDLINNTVSLTLTRAVGFR